MKKVILSAIALCAFTFANAQSHQKGTMQVNIMGGFLTGSVTSQSDAAGSDKIKFTATGAQFGAQFQYGLAENFSAGIGLEIGTAVLTPKDDNSYGTNPSLSLFKVNFSGRYYFLNKEKFNIYAGPSVGFSSGKDTSSSIGFSGGETSTKFSGLNYGINAGGSYFFTDIVGVTANLGYEGNALKYTTTDPGNPDDTGKFTIGGAKIMVGLALKFK